jgi:AcrR family transcriptional regulator
LDAAQELFGQHGFEGTTIREIGERAGVDHALIARYYGSKADLYIAALVAEVRGDQLPSDFEGLKDMTEGMVTRMDSHGLGPVMQALIRTETAGPVYKAARAHMARRMVDPMVDEVTRRSADEARLRSELVVSALIGISLGRALGWFDELMAVPKEHLVDLVTELLDNG